MLSNLLRAAALAALLAPGWSRAAPLSLERAIDLAITRSAAVEGARDAARGAAESARAAGQLPDPMLEAGIENLPAAGPDRLSTTADPMTMKRIGLSQQWISADKRALRRSAADAQTTLEELRAQAAAADARLQTALSYVDVWYAQRSRDLAERSRAFAREDAAATLARLRGGAGSSAEALAAQAAAGLADDDVADAEQQRRVQALLLARWIGIEPDDLQPPALPLPPDEQRFVAQAPAVLLAAQVAETARLEAEVTASQRRPDWTWQIAYQQRTGYPDMVSFGLSIPLQIDRAERQDRETAAKQAQAEQLRADLQEAQRNARARYRMLASETQRLRDRIDRLRAAVLAPARERSAAALAAFGGNAAPLANALEARRAEVEAERKLLQMQRSLDRTLAELDYTPVAQVQGETR